MSPMFIIAKREFRSYFDSPIAYVVIKAESGIGTGTFQFGVTDWNATGVVVDPVYNVFALPATEAITA